MSENKMPNKESTNRKAGWRKLFSWLCFFAGIIMWVLTAIMKVFNFCLEIILIFCGKIKLVSRADDD